MDYLNKNDNYKYTDEAIKIETFDKIFGKTSLSVRDIKRALAKSKRKTSIKHQTNITEKTRNHLIKELYYSSKHQILENKEWSGYLESTQSLVNLNQTFCFGMWILYVFSFIGFIVTLIASLRDKKHNKESKHTYIELSFLSFFVAVLIINIFNDSDINVRFEKVNYSISLPLIIILCTIIVFSVQFRQIHGHRLTTSLLFMITTMFLYHLTAIAWQNCEAESCAKTYGLLIHMDDELNKIAPEIFRNTFK